MFYDGIPCIRGLLFKIIIDSVQYTAQHVTAWLKSCPIVSFLVILYSVIKKISGGKESQIELGGGRVDLWACHTCCFRFEKSIMYSNKRVERWARVSRNKDGEFKWTILRHVSRTSIQAPQAAARKTGWNPSLIWPFKEPRPWWIIHESRYDVALTDQSHIEDYP